MVHTLSYSTRLLLGLTLQVVASYGQVTLNLRDAQQLVEHTPEFVRYQAMGYCPESSDGTLESGHALFVIRGECRTQPTIGNYDVDLVTGAINSLTGPIDTSELARLRHELFSERAAARLTREEAQCLFSELAAEFPGGRNCLAAHLGREGDGWFDVQIEDKCGKKGARRVVAARIDRYTGRVTNETTGDGISSPAFDTLRSNFLLSRSKPELTADEAKRLVGNLPAVVAAKDRQCLRIDTAYEHNADDLWFQVTYDCGGHVIDLVVVNRRTGLVFDRVSNVAYDTPGLQELRSNFLGAARSRRLQAPQALQQACAIKIHAQDNK